MRKTMLFAILVGAMLWLSGCVAVMDEHRSGRTIRVFHAPPRRVVEVVRVPSPPPRPYPHHDGPRHRR